MSKHGGVLSKAIRDSILAASDFSCCICGIKFFCDVHHIKPLSKGGSNKESNLIVLCPNHHRLVHTGAYSVRQIRQIKREHLALVKERVKHKDHMTYVQENQVFSFVYDRCISQSYNRDDYLDLPSENVFTIVQDFFKVITIVDPIKGEGLFFTIDEVYLPLSSLEIVDSPFRMLFLIEQHNILGAEPIEYRIVRLDVIESVSGVQENIKIRPPLDECREIAKWQRRIRKLLKSPH